MQVMQGRMLQIWPIKNAANLAVEWACSRNHYISEDLLWLPLSGALFNVLVLAFDLKPQPGDLNKCLLPDILVCQVL